MNRKILRRISIVCVFLFLQTTMQGVIAAADTENAPQTANKDHQSHQAGLTSSAPSEINSVNQCHDNVSASVIDCDHCNNCLAFIPKFFNFGHHLKSSQRPVVTFIVNQAQLIPESPPPRPFS